jgi:hypothetical protein
MSEQSTQEEPRTAVLEHIDPDEPTVPFRHGLGGEVTVAAYGHDGEPIGYHGAFVIDENEVEVMVVPGTVARLVAEPAPPEADD